MRTYWLRLYPQQPLQLDEPSVIPARALRGALVAVLQRNCIPGASHDSGPCNPDCVFWAIFGTSAPGATIRIGNAYVSRQDAIELFPATARMCALVPGFRDQEGHGVTDVAIRAWVFERAVTADPGRLSIPFEERCAQCDAELVPCMGRMVRTGEREWRAAQVMNEVKQTTHRPARSIDSAIYTRHSVVLSGPPGSAYYVARIDVPEALDSLLRETLIGGLVVGGGRTRGMGLVRAELAARPDPTLTTHTRIAAFNQALRAELRFYGVMASGVPGNTGQLLDDGAWYFTLDVIDMQWSGWQPDPLADIKALRDVQTVRRWVTISSQDGRSTVTGLRSGARQLLSGTFLCHASPDADRAALEQSLAYLETHGIGLGSERGYGNANVCDPFHLESDPL